MAPRLVTRILTDAAHGRRISLFETKVGDSSYQIVAQLTYKDAFNEHLSDVVGFTVNLGWVQDHYFADLTRQVWEIGAGAEKGLRLSVTDGVGRQVAGSAIAPGTALTNRRTFALAFVNPDIVLEVQADILKRPWTVEVSADSEGEAKDAAWAKLRSNAP